MFPSSTALRDHLLLCGNKTDSCPNCRHLIRRSHFAYHYENNCAPIDEVETPPSRPKSRAMQSAPTNSNKPVLRVDIPADTPPNNYSNHNSPRSNGKSPLVLSVPSKYFHVSRKYGFLNIAFILKLIHKISSNVNIVVNDV